MQKTQSTRSSLRCPLDQVFGSSGHVRIIRVLTSQAEKPLHPSEVAVLAGMTESAARRGLQRLSRTGLVQRCREGRGECFRFLRRGALARGLEGLFQAERAEGESLAHAIRQVAQDLPDPPALCWLQDFLSGWSDCREVAVHFHRDRPGEADGVEELREGLTAVAEEFDLMLEVRPYAREELEGVPWTEVVILLGSPPDTPSRDSGRESDLRSGDGRSRNPFPEDGRLNPASPEFSGALVALLEENLSVLRRARESVRGKLQEGANGNGYDLWEWQKILDTFSVPRLLSFLESDSPRAVRLRKCSPFPAVLSEEEKARLAEYAARPD